MGELKPASWPDLFDAVSSARQLFERVGQGDRDAFQAIYACYGARVMAMVRRQVVVQQLAEELVQDVFIAVWLGARGYRQDMGDPEHWVLGITRHKLQEHWRQVRRLVMAMGVHAREAKTNARMPDTDLRLAMEEALARLPLEQRSVLDLIYRRGMTFAETAHALGLPRGTVKSRVHAALLTLRHLFERSNPS
jgi:RNA polymerase sigma-70 factor (ECF subfamily)